MYKLISGNTVIKYKSFASATNKLIEFGNGKLYFKGTLVGEL